MDTITGIELTSLCPPHREDPYDAELTSITGEPDATSTVAREAIGSIALSAESQSLSSSPSSSPTDSMDGMYSPEPTDQLPGRQEPSRRELWYDRDIRPMVDQMNLAKGMLESGYISQAKAYLMHLLPNFFDTLRQELEQPYPTDLFPSGRDERSENPDFITHCMHISFYKWSGFRYNWLEAVWDPTPCRTIHLEGTDYSKESPILTTVHQMFPQKEGGLVIAHVPSSNIKAFKAEIAEQGWQIVSTPEGPLMRKGYFDSEGQPHETAPIARADGENSGYHISDDDTEVCVPITIAKIPSQNKSPCAWDRIRPPLRA